MARGKLPQCKLYLPIRVPRRRPNRIPNDIRRFQALRRGRFGCYNGIMTLRPSNTVDPFNATGLRALAQRTLHRHPLDLPADTPIAAGPSDFELDPEAVAEFAPKLAQRPAAVLVPVIARTELTLLFTLRTDHLQTHAGQISFPGGKIDSGEDALNAALREAEEEIGLARAHVEPIGYLDSYRTGTGYRITPVVALVRPEFSISHNAGEVAETFEVPLAFLLDERNFRTDTRIIGGRERSFYAIPYGRRYIWGATAGILKNMHKRLTEL